MKADSHLAEGLPASQEPRELCLNCLTANVEGSNFCRQCGGPLSAYAAIGPWEHIFAEGHIYRKAVERPQKLIVVLGMWLVFGPVALMGIGLSALEWTTQSLLQKLFFATIAMISAVLIFKTTVSYFRQKQSSSDSTESPDHTDK